MPLFTQVSPTKANGKVEGLPYFFRSFYSYWEFCVVRYPEQDPEMLIDDNTDLLKFYLKSSHDTTKGEMSLNEARKYIAYCISMYRESLHPNT